jgi:hypothetical protein
MSNYTPEPCGCVAYMSGGGIQFCPLHSAAPDMLAALRFAQAVLEEHIASDCDMCGGEGGWEGEGLDARMTPVRHKSGCEYPTVTAAIAKAEDR